MTALAFVAAFTGRYALATGVFLVGVIVTIIFCIAEHIEQLERELKDARQRERLS